MSAEKRRDSVPGFEPCMLFLNHHLENVGSPQRLLTYEEPRRKSQTRPKAAKWTRLVNTWAIFTARQKSFGSAPCVGTCSTTVMVGTDHNSQHANPAPPGPI